MLNCHPYEKAINMQVRKLTAPIRYEQSKNIIIFINWSSATRDESITHALCRTVHFNINCNFTLTQEMKMYLATIFFWMFSVHRTTMFIFNEQTMMQIRWNRHLKSPSREITIFTRTTIIFYYHINWTAHFMQISWR